MVSPRQPFQTTEALETFANPGIQTRPENLMAREVECLTQEGFIVCTDKRGYLFLLYHPDTMATILADELLISSATRAALKPPSSSAWSQPPPAKQVKLGSTQVRQRQVLMDQALALILLEQRTRDGLSPNLPKNMYLNEIKMYEAMRPGAVWEGETDKNFYHDVFQKYRAERKIDVARWKEKQVKLPHVSHEALRVPSQTFPGVFKSGDCWQLETIVDGKVSPMCFIL
jgi:hypothetical protein